MKSLALILAVMGLVLVPSASAGKITVSGSYDGTYIDLGICGTGNRTVEVRVIAPDGSTQVGQIVNYGSDCYSWNDGFPASQPGTYTVEVGNLSHNNTYASTTVTVP